MSFCTMLPILLTLIAIFVFSGASVFYSEYAKKYSALWMNTFKAIVALTAFTLTTVFMIASGTSDWSRLDSLSALCLLGSGVMGLAIGDIFLLMAYSRIGSSRSLMIFSFQPLFIGLQAYLLFGQVITPLQWLAIGFLMACVFVISLERFRLEGHWEVRGILFAVIGVILDNIGVILTRFAFDRSGINAIEANWVRCIGAVVILLLILKFRKGSVLAPLKMERPSRRAVIVVSSVAGTYISLICWLTAVKTGHLATISAIGGMNPLAAGLWEWLLIGKRPTGPFLLGFVFSMCALALLLIP